MKKVISYLLIMGMVSPLNAGLITHTDYVAGQTITATLQNTNENTIVNEFNGNIESANIKDGTIVVADLSAAVQGSFVPTGSVIQFAGAAAPTGYLLCDGSAVNRTTYATLFTAIGTTYGAGDNATTFNVPDFRGRTTIGAGTGSGINPKVLGTNYGVETSTLTTNELPAHSHTVTITDPSHSHQITLSNTGGSSDTINANRGGAGAVNINSGNNNTGETAVTASSGTGAGFSNLPPSVAINFIIKY